MYAELQQTSAEFAHMTSIVDSVLASPRRDALAATTSMHDLVVTDTPESDNPEVVVVRAPGSLRKPPLGRVRIEHLALNGRNDVIDRPVGEAASLFWRFCAEKFGIVNEVGPARSSAMEFDQLFVAVNLTLRRTEDGGRESAILGDREGAYRPNWSVAVADAREQSGAPVLVMNPTTVAPGDSARAVLVPLYPPHWTNVEVGTRLFMYEGARDCGEAVVAELWTADEPSSDESRARARSWVASD